MVLKGHMHAVGDQLTLLSVFKFHNRLNRPKSCLLPGSAAGGALKPAFPNILDKLPKLVRCKRTLDMGKVNHANFADFSTYEFPNHSWLLGIAVRAIAGGVLESFDFPSELSIVGDYRGINHDRWRLRLGTRRILRPRRGHNQPAKSDWKYGKLQPLLIPSFHGCIVSRLPRVFHCIPEQGARGSTHSTQHNSSAALVFDRVKARSTKRKSESR